MPALPLKGVIVVDLSRLIPGPFCSLILADLGARVIKVEDPQRGDYLKDVGPRLPDGPGVLFSALNRNKEHLAINLKSRKGHDLFCRLIRKADVLIEGFRPGVMKNLKLSQAKLRRINGSLIVASITGYGQWGPNSRRAGHDLNYLSLAGLLTNRSMPAVQWADLVGGGLMAAMAILASLFRRQSTGRGELLDISMTDNMIFLGMANLLATQCGMGDSILSGELARYRIYKASDGGQIALAALEDKFWNKFCDLVHKPSWKGLTGQYRDRSKKIHRELQNLFLTKTRDQWVSFFRRHDICLSPVLSAEEVVRSSQFIQRGFHKKAKIGRRNILFPITPVTWSGKGSSPTRSSRGRTGSSKILKQLGYSQMQMKALVREGVVR